MKILFVFPINYPVYPFQIGSLSSVLKRKGYKTDMLMLIIEDALSSEHFLEIEKKVRSFKPDLVAFSSYEMSFEWIKSISTYIKQKFDLPTIVGGYHATLCPQEVINHPSIDVVCRGEGEYALLELMEKSERGEETTHIRNLWVRHDGRVFRNEIRSLIENLDELPYVDREIMDYQEHLNLEPEGERTVEMMGSRGCPFNCSYCSNHAFRQLYPNKNKYVRWRSIPKILDEINAISSKYKFEKTEFHDDTFTLSRKWLKEFCERYPKEFSYPFSCNVRPETCKMDNLKLLKRAGCWGVSIGVESGDEALRNHILRRYMSNSEIIQAFRNAKKVGLKAKAFNMIGLPFESRLSILKTLWLNAKIAPDYIQTSVFYPFEGTDLGDLCYEKNLVDLNRKKGVKSYVFDSILKTSSLTTKEIRLWKYLISLTALRSGNPEMIKILYRSAKEVIKHKSLTKAVLIAQHLQRGES